MKKTVEICCGSYYDCIQAYKGNAQRVELNSALHMGGLTPTVASLALTKQNTNLKVICMVRPRGAGFCYGKEDYETIILDTKSMLDYGADGIAFGCLDELGGIDVLKTKEIIKVIRAYGNDKEIVFHRAFDCVLDPRKSLELLISLGVNRVLTSGLEEKAIYGLDLLKELQENYGDKIEIMAGSGINVSNAADLMNYTGITQIHSSCKAWIEDRTTTKNNVSYAYSGDKYCYDVVDSKLVEQLVDLCSSYR